MLHHVRVGEEHRERLTVRKNDEKRGSARRMARDDLGSFSHCSHMIQEDSGQEFSEPIPRSKSCDSIPESAIN